MSDKGGGSQVFQDQRLMISFILIIREKFTSEYYISISNLFLVI